ncbi:MAG: DUF3500 domain-containing protein [Chloroflexota bacterium]
MRQKLSNPTVMLLLFTIMCLVTACNPFAADTPTSAPLTDDGTVEILDTAGDSALLGALDTLNATLSTEQITSLYLPLGSDLRQNWSNLPANITDFERNGIRTGDLDDQQLAALLGFLEAALSSDGYQKTMQIVRADEILGQQSPETGDELGWTEDNFWLAIFGTPSATEAWAWQFGGHHLAINVTVKGQDMVLTPSFLGVEPAVYDDNGEMFAPLKQELEGGIALIAALNANQQAEAVVNERPEEVYAGAGQDGYVPPFEGSNIGTWTDGQQAMLWDLVNLWIGILPDEAAASKLAEAQLDWDETHFAWHGATDGTGSIYYRIQGPRLLIEFSIQGNIGDDAGHYHSVYRDTTREYGSNLTGLSN